MHATLLQLAPEFGGTVFGPFPPGPVALGSDASRCAVALAPAVGARPIHCWVTPAPDGSWFLQPAEAGAALYVLGPGGARAVTTAVPLRAGEAFAIGHPQGPRFTVQAAASPGGAAVGSAAPGASRAGGRRPPTAADMAAEVRRQASVYAMSSGPFAPLVHLFYRAKSGALWQPRYIVGAIIGLFGFLFAGCGGLFAILARHLH